MFITLVRLKNSCIFNLLLAFAKATIALTQNWYLVDRKIGHLGSLTPNWLGMPLSFNLLNVYTIFSVLNV